MSRSKRKHANHEATDEGEVLEMPTCKVGEQVFLFSTKYKDGDQPCPATVAHVNDDGTVNLGYLDKEGFPKSMVRVCLVAAGDEMAEAGCLHCRRELPDPVPEDAEATELEPTA